HRRERRGVRDPHVHPPALGGPPLRDLVARADRDRRGRRLGRLARDVSSSAPAGRGRKRPARHLYVRRFGTRRRARGLRWAPVVAKSAPREERRALPVDAGTLRAVLTSHVFALATRTS